MKQVNINHKIDSLTRTFCCEAAAQELQKYRQKKEQDTLLLLHHRFVSPMSQEERESALSAIGFWLHDAFPYPAVIARVAETAFFVCYPGYLEQLQICHKLDYYQNQLKIQASCKHVEIHYGACYGDATMTFNEMLAKVENRMRYALQENKLLYLGACQHLPLRKKPYPHTLPPFSLPYELADAKFIFAMIELLYEKETMHAGIDAVMEQLCAYFQVQHVYIMMRACSGEEFYISHEYILQKTSIMNDNLKKMSSFIGERYQKAFDANGMITCNRMEELKYYDVFMEERQRLRGVHALMQHMLVEHDAYIGYVTLLDLNKERIWMPRQMATLHYLSHILSLALQQERLQKQSETMTQYDHLTNAWKLERFTQHAKKALLQKQDTMALLTLDLKHFKMINAEYGYSYGNQILVAMAQILRQIMEPSEMFARMDADKFVVLLHYNNNNHLTQRLQDILRRMEHMAIIQNFDFQILCMIGVYLIQDPDLPISCMIDYANSARKQIKDYHKSSYAFFNDAQEEHKRKEHHFLQDILTGFHNHEFLVYYQPKIHIPDRRCYGLEALIRWKHKDEIIPPDAFIPLFEKHGYIDELDMFVLREVCKQLHIWIQEKKQPLSIAVNISGIHLRDAEIVTKICNVCSHYEIPRNLIELEITESAMLEDIDDVMQKAIAFKQAGFKLSMDDFGTGFSSLSILKNLPVDIIKLDRAFFQKVMNQREKIIISNVIHMAQQLNINVISEGIETIEHIRFLQEIGCEEAQGFYFSRPQPMEKLEPLLWQKFPMEDV